MRMVNNMKLKYKLIFFYIIVVMIPVLIAGVILTNYFSGGSLEQSD
ncbi:hypothetical protein ACFSQ7_07585 [Paenibacillus rhizoplanae]